MRLIHIAWIIIIITGCERSIHNDVNKSLQEKNEKAIEAKENDDFPLNLVIFDNTNYVKEYKLFEGNWEADSIQTENKIYRKSDLVQTTHPRTLIITNKVPVDCDKRCDIYKFEIDPLTSPKRITATITGGEIKGYCYKGIYQFKNQMLIIHFSELSESGGYPKSFNFIPKGSMLITLTKKTQNKT